LQCSSDERDGRRPGRSARGNAPRPWYSHRHEHRRRQGADIPRHRRRQGADVPRRRRPPAADRRRQAGCPDVKQDVRMLTEHLLNRKTDAHE